MLLQSNRSLAAIFAVALALALRSGMLTPAPSPLAPVQAGAHLVYAAPSAPVLM